MKYGKRIVLFTLFAMNLVDQPAPEVVIEQGILSGIVSTDGTMLQYLGIPYATTNSSSRFQAPLPPPSWKGVHKAVDEIYRCPQHSAKIGVAGTEDCLKINVYVPAIQERPLAVMVYVHGGAFLLGSGGKLLYAPDFLVQQGVIVVTFNYRLGALGFLCLGIKEAPGNAGLRDQIAALKWVKKNIAAFGGDPDNITLFGESAGGASVALLIASDAANGLFQRAIVQSGASSTNWAINRHPLKSASLLAKHLGYDTEDPQELYSIFSKLHYKHFTLPIDAIKKPLDVFFDTQLLHLPCVEKPIPGIEPVISDVPYNLLTKTRKNISVIYGTTSKEGLFLVSAEANEEMIEERNGRYLFASDLEFPNETEAAVVAEIVKKRYFGEERISYILKPNLVNLYTQLYFEVPSKLDAEVLINRLGGSNSVYNFYFNYSGGRNFMKHFTGTTNETGSCHGDEILYLFKGNLWPFRINKKDRIMIDWMTKMWTNFAKYGVPTPESDLPVRWEPSTKDEMKFLYIEDELKMGPMPNQEDFRMWKDIYRKYRRKRYK